MSSLKELTGTAADRPIISAVALGTLVASANAPQEEDETDQEFKKRKSNVSKYLRQYGSKFYSGDELDDFVNSYLTEYAKGGVVSLNTPRDMYLEGGKVYLEEGGTPEDMVSFTDFPSGVIYMDPEGNPITKEEFLRRTMEAEEEEKRQIKEQLDIDEDKEAPSIKKAKGGIAEIDLREKGGFVPMGKKEKADDVPAMLSKNEFVLTADAVRGIGDGNVEKGAQRLYDLMGEAEKVGRGVA